MKKIILIIGVIVLVSCKKNKQEEVSPDTVESAKIEESAKQCFQLVANNDTITMVSNVNAHNIVNGELV